VLFLNSTTKQITFVCTFTYKQRNKPFEPFLSCSMCIYICRKMRSGPVQNGLDQSRIWTACPDMLSRFFDLDSHVPLSGLDLDQIWTESGIGQKPSGPIFATTHFPPLGLFCHTKKLVRFEVRFVVHQIVPQIMQKPPWKTQFSEGVLARFEVRF
jgi:hypothetical protein